MGSCIQCSVKTCKTAYHVTCAFKHGLEMRAIIEDENAEDGVKLRVSFERLNARNDVNRILTDLVSVLLPETQSQLQEKVGRFRLGKWRQKKKYDRRRKVAGTATEVSPLSRLIFNR